MNNDPKAILLRILDIIEYKNDKNQFANEFIDLCCREAILSGAASLPKEKKDSLDTQLTDNHNIDSIVSSLQQTIGKEEYQKHLEIVSQKMFTDYLTTIMPTLSENQKNELTACLATLNK